MGETEPYVWLFPEIDDAAEMAPVWLEAFYKEPVVILKIILPDDWPIEYTGSDYEICTSKAIPPAMARSFFCSFALFILTPFQ